MSMVDHAVDQARASADPHSPWHLRDAWWNGSAAHAIELAFADTDTQHAVAIRPRTAGAVAIDIDGRKGEASAVRRDGRLAIVGEGASFIATVVRARDDRHVFAPGTRRKLTLVDPLAHAVEEEAHVGHLMAPMSGTIVAVMVKPGDRVAKGAALVVLEAMKMEHVIAAPAAGVVTSINFGIGERVPEGADLVDLDDSAP